MLYPSVRLRPKRAFRQHRIGSLHHAAALRLFSHDIQRMFRHQCHCHRRIRRRIGQVPPFRTGPLHRKRGNDFLFHPAVRRTDYPMQLLDIRNSARMPSVYAGTDLHRFQYTGNGLRARKCRNRLRPARSFRICVRRHRLPVSRTGRYHDYHRGNLSCRLAKLVCMHMVCPAQPSLSACCRNDTQIKSGHTANKCEVFLLRIEKKRIFETMKL